MIVVLTDAAEDDVMTITLIGDAVHGRAQTERYIEGLIEAINSLAAFPYAYRERPELRPPARVRPYGVHVIVYVVAPDVIRVLRIRHGREDWLNS